MNTQMLSLQSQRMTRGGTLNWWDFDSAASDEMTYECDSNLGNPAAADCSEIQWHQLPLSSDTLAVSPGTTTFFHQNSCYLAITASVPLVLSWAQILTALSTLMNTCVETSNRESQGGRAFYKVPVTPRNKVKSIKSHSEPNGLTGTSRFFRY